MNIVGFINRALELLPRPCAAELRPCGPAQLRGCLLASGIRLCVFWWLRHMHGQHPAPPSEDVSAIMLIFKHSFKVALLAFGQPPTWSISSGRCSGCPYLEILRGGLVVDESSAMTTWLAPLGRDCRRGSTPKPKKRQLHAEVADMSLYQHQPGSVRPDALLSPPESIRERCHLIGSVTSMRSTSSIISVILFAAIFNGTCHCRHSRTTSVIKWSCDYPGLHPGLFRH